MAPLPFNRVAILEALTARLKAPSRPRHPLALFDWDGTLVGTDTGDLLFFHAARAGLLAMPQAPLAQCLPWLTPAGATLLERLVDGSQHGDQDLWMEQLTAYYGDGVTPEGQSAFLPWQTNHFQPSYAILGPLLASAAPSQLRRELRTMLREGILARGHQPMPGGQRLGLHIALVKPLAEMFLVARLLKLKVIVVSASPQALVEEGLNWFGLQADAVLGLRCNPDGTLAHPGGDAPNPCIPYGEGKNAWIDWYLRQQGLEGAEVLLAAGNSLGDRPMLRRATTARIFVQEGPKRPALGFRDKVPLWIMSEPRL
jgi:phosphoserine phosphatase